MSMRRYEGGAGGTSPRLKVFLRLLQSAASRTVRARTAAVKVERPTGRTTLTACSVGTPASVTPVGRDLSADLLRPLLRSLLRALLRGVWEGSGLAGALSGLLRARSA